MVQGASCVSITRLSLQAPWTAVGKTMKARTCHAISAPTVSTSALIFHHRSDKLFHVVVPMPQIKLPFTLRHQMPKAVHIRSSMALLLGRYAIDDIRSRGRFSKNPFSEPTTTSFARSKYHVFFSGLPSRACRHRRPFPGHFLVFVG